MGMSTPKPRFNLAEFLNEKASPASRRRPTWKRQAAQPEADTAEEPTGAEPTSPTDE